MQLPGLGRIGQGIVDLLAFPPARYDPAFFQNTQVVGNGGGAHIHGGRNIADALLTMAEQP